MKRRTFIQASATLSTLSFAAIPPAWSSPMPDAPRVLFVLLRGGMDGLTAAPPLGDTNYLAIRPNIGIQRALRLNADFGLHPELSSLHRLWQSQQLALIHSTGFLYTGRSHFEGQDIMQTGLSTPYASSSGWVGRTMEHAKVPGGVAISIPMPMLLRGNQRSSTEFPNWMPNLRGTDTAAVAKLWGDDPTLAGFASAIHDANVGADSNGMGRGKFQEVRSMRGLARVAAAQMRDEGGPRVGLIDMRNGFDTHANQGAETGSHATQLRTLNELVETFQQEMQQAWKHALVVTITEFGRTAAENGTTGTDHGVGTCCFVAGGLVSESRVYADWRGLEKKNLFEERDLPATIDIHAVYAKVLQRAFQIPEQTLQSNNLLTFRPHPSLRSLLPV